jgi:hypothetical protein
MERWRAAVLASLAAASGAMINLVHGVPLDSVLIAATTGPAGMAVYLATPDSIKLSFRLPFVYGWHRLIVRGRTWLWSRVRPVQHDVCRASSLLKGQQCVGTDARRPG